jgi:hypothetical protein
VELNMSVYVVNYLCRELLRDHEFRAAMKADPAAAIARYDLTAEEREALLAGDVARLYRLGVNAFRWATCRASRCGLTMPIYSERIRSAAEVRAGRVLIYAGACWTSASGQAEALGNRDEPVENDRSGR